MNFSLLLAAKQASAGAGSMIVTLLPMVVILGGMYFFLMRPQKKQEAQHKALLENMEIGDSVLTTSGFYGMVIDISEDTVIVEFGGNKNCRIPMQKSAIVDVEKVDA